jgi:predicted dehydrogenase
VSVGAALIGATGRWGSHVAEAAARASELELVSCHARDGEACRAFAEEHGLLAAGSLAEAVEADGVEVALLITPNDLHAEHALACAERGKHVFVEKPIASTLEDAERMRDRFREAGLVLAVGHGMRRLGAARRVKELLDEGALGTVVLAEANWSLPSRLTPQAWRWYRDRGRGGPLIQLGIHHADTLAYWLGPIARSFGALGRVVTEAETEDVGVVGLELASGAVGVITGSYVSPRTYFLRLYGDRAVLEYDVDMSVWPHAHRVDGATTLTLRTADGAERIEFEERDPLAEQLDELARAVRGEAIFETGPDEGVAALRAILDALPSA